MIIEIVPTIAIETIWDDVKDFITRTNEDVFNDNDIKDNLLNGNFILWIAIDEESKRIIAVMTTEFVQYPRDKICRIVTIAGERMKEWLGELDMVKKWAKEQGCSYLDMYGRRGWIKVLPDWQVNSVLFRKKL